MTITRSTPSLSDQLKGAAKDFLKQTLLGNDYPSENILHNYRVFAYRVTLGIISSTEWKNKSYKKKGLDYVVFSSHGKIPAGGATSGTGSSKLLNDIQKFVNALGDTSTKSMDFFLEDLYIKSYMSGSRDWATEMKLKVVEPYGIDSFLTNIITGLTQKGYYNFDKSNHFVLKIDFIGYPDDSEVPEVVPYSTRWYPICITGFKANLTQQGTIYEITARPINDMAKFDDVNKVSEFASIKGDTIGEVMKSLETALNDLAKAETEVSGLVANKYTIQFVNEKGEVDAGSWLYDQKMFNQLTDKGNKSFLKNKKSYISPLSPNEKDAENAQDRKIVLNVNLKDGLTNIVDTIITDSYYVVDNIRTQFTNGRDSDGDIMWWRVHAELFNGPFDHQTNKHSKEVVINIAPRKVHYSKLVTLFVPNAVVPAEHYERMTARKYEWQYTGNNRDILNLNLNFDQLWTKVITGKLGRTAATPGEDKAVNTKAETPSARQRAGSVEAPAGTEISIGAGNVTKAPDSDESKRKAQIRSSAETSPSFSLARDVNALINNPYEQITATIEILGDPMWLGTQFIDTANSVNKSSSLFTIDGGMAMRTVDPIIRVLAYAPRDFNSEGFLTGDEGYAGATGGRALSKYSAYYTVRQVESYFQGGVFKQKLTCYRNSAQDLRNMTTSAQDRFSFKQIDLSIKR